MQESKLLQLLSAFEAEEIRQLYLFSDTPLFNNGKRPQKVKALLHYLLAFYPEFEDVGLEKECVFTAVYPEEDFKKNKLDKLSSELIFLVLKFIDWLQRDVYSEDREADYQLRLVQFFQERHMTVFFENAVKKLQKHQDKHANKEQAYFFRQFRLEVEKMKFKVWSNDKKKDANLPATLQALDQFYVLTKMEYSSYLLSQRINTRLDVGESMAFLNEILTFAGKYLLDIPAIAAYYHSFPVLDKSFAKNDQAYQELKKSLDHFEGEISKETLLTIHSYMRNYLSDRYNQGDSGSLAKLFDLFEDQIHQETIYQDGHYILASTLQSAITVAIKLEKYQWALDFLMKHQNRITGADNPEAIYTFNLANIYFHQGEYDSSETTLQKLYYREMFYNLAFRRLELKLIYETRRGEVELFESKLKAFKSFIQSKKKELPADKFEPNNNFFNLLSQLWTQVKNGKIDSRKIQKLIQKLNSLKAVAEREWLLEKMEELL